MYITKHVLYIYIYIYIYIHILFGNFLHAARAAAGAVLQYSCSSRPFHAENELFCSQLIQVSFHVLAQILDRRGPKFSSFPKKQKRHFFTVPKTSIHAKY